MNFRFSLYLDLLRFLAAIAVFVSHFAYTRFTDGDYIILRELNIGSDAVVFFFVLSGLVIAYTAEVKDTTLKAYSFNRITRLYSVILPALILTIILDLWGAHISPHVYDGWWYNATPVWEQLFRGLTLSNSWFGESYRLGTNGPYWSLSYEAAYYILFGIMFYLSGFKRYLIALPLVFVFGFSVMLLFPVWLLGLWAYRQIRNQALPSLYAWPCAVFPPVIYILMLCAEIPKTLLLTTIGVLGEDFVSNNLFYSDEFIWNFIIAQLIVFHLIGMAALFEGGQGTAPDKIRMIIRWFAGATFTIYIVHYPALQFADAVLPETWAPFYRHAVLFISVLVGCFLFAEISERRLKWIRRKLRLIS